MIDDASDSTGMDDDTGETIRENDGTKITTEFPTKVVAARENPFALLMH